MTSPTLTIWQEAAARRYGEDFEGSKRDHFSRIDAMDRLQAARAILSPMETAVMDMIAGRRNTLEELASKTHRSRAFLSQLFTDATTKLARHYEAGEPLAA